MLPGDIVFALVFGGVGAMLVFIGIALFIQVRRFAADAIRTSAIVVENKAAHEQREDGMGRNTYYYPVFEFKDLQGIKRRLRSSTGSSPPSYSIGAEVQVLYSRDDPASAKIDSFRDLWFTPVLASTLGALLMPIPVYTVYLWVQNNPVSLSVMGFTIPGSTQASKTDSQLQAPGRTAPPSDASKPSIKPGSIKITAAEPNPAKIGEPITLRGTNFGLQRDHYVWIGGHGISVDPQVIEWNKDAVTVKIPDDPRIQKGASYWYRIARIDRSRGGTHIIEGSNLFMFRLESGSESQPVDPPGAAVQRITTAPEWNAVGSIAGSRVYADSANLHKSGEIVTMWGLLDNKTARQSPGKPYMSVKAQFKYDCKEERVQMLYRSFHSGNMAKGDIVDSNSFDEYWKPIAPASLAATLWRFACAKR